MHNRPLHHDLDLYKAFSDSVDGELMPSLVARLLSLAQVRLPTLLLDLGLDVGKVVLQVALQSGCSGFGVELMEKLVDMACEQHAQIIMHTRM